MKCRFVRPIFQNKETGYCIFCYFTEDNSVPVTARSSYYKDDGIQFTAVGSNLPDTDTIEVELEGRWVKNNHGTQFEVDSYKEILPRTKEGIKGYLSSGMIKGIGPKTAEVIVEKYGLKTFDVFDHYPDSLLSIKGITESKLKIIMASYHGSQVMRDLAAYLTPFNVTPRKIQKIYESFGERALDTIKNHPFELCKISGFGFLTVDEIAKANKGKLNDPMRIEGCIYYCFEKNDQEGHLYQDKKMFQERVYEQLNEGYIHEVVSELEVYHVLCKLVKERQLYYENRALYPAKYYEYETGAAEEIASLLIQKSEPVLNVEFLISEAQKDLSITLSAKQEEAVKKAFSNLVSIITGGPGTGKTTVQKVLLYINEKLGGKTVLLTAPTGRASRRMAESTGRNDAATMHSVLGLNHSEECEAIDEILEMDFIIADEFSMSDMRLSYEFFRHIKKGARLILIGDMNQLPSVGPGNVFRELIMCGVIPVTTLDMVFRQAENSRIAINAYRIQENNAKFEYGKEFDFYKANSTEHAAQIVEKVYRESVRQYGADAVQVLTPFRKRGEVSVDALNELLRDIVNPAKDGKKEIRYGKRKFRVGDRILHNQNRDRISNGDMGYVADIYTNEDNVQVARLEFSEGRTVEYSSDDLELIEHALATTVHKSQGSEYPVVILPWVPMFYKMLRREILYTAITRAKVKVVIVGSKQSIYKAVHDTGSDKRNTKLGERVVKEYNRLLEKQLNKKPKELYVQQVINL